MVLGETLGSDHRFVTLTISGMRAAVEEASILREVWKTEDLPVSADETSVFVNAFERTMADWTQRTKSSMKAMEAVGIEAKRIGDIVEWSFQAALDGQTDKLLGTKMVGPKVTPLLDSAMRVLDGQRKACELILRKTMSNGSSSAEERKSAVKLYRDAKASLFKATARRKEMCEQETFRQIEEKQSDSKLLWARSKRLTRRLKAGVSPPPMAMGADGKVESDPIEVLKIWRRFSAEMASMTPEEEGIYDEEHKSEVEQRLEKLRADNRDVFQPELDGLITADEVWWAIRKMKMGKAPGVDGVLSSIVRHAADAVGKSKMDQGGSSFVDAMVLMFNYVFDTEEWPERWGSGIIFPLYKQDSRLEPGNFRPITLLSIVGKLFGLIVEKRLSDWSESNGIISDEQGGFRRKRGTPDQIFIMRELISSRKERNLPTLVTYIDARKAYDTVWREGNYVRLFDIGVQGKMWRQIQAMGKNMKHKVRLDIGETEWHEVRRGVAQGAVESPWLYSCFIDGLVEELKSRGLGIMFCGRRIPLLMYADDIVMFASSVSELQQMNDVASEYARKNRFRHNGKKSAVMTFNASPQLKKRVNQTRWALSGEKVGVEETYKYLGVDLVNNTADWKPHVSRLIRTARKRSNDLLWMCRRDKGIRPRTAATLWKAMVRPVLEYASELWAGDATQELAKQAESMQTDFARAILGLQGQWAISNAFVRAEMGLEKLSSRWEKLRLGYWRRLNTAEGTRALAAVARTRMWQVKWGGAGVGARSWMRGTRDLLQTRGLTDHWTVPSECAAMTKAEWKKVVYNAVEGSHEAAREQECETMVSMERYIHVKDWSRTSKDRAEYSGEIGRLGALVVERYLDDVKDRFGSRLKLMCRAGCLPTIARVAWELGINNSSTGCVLCDTGREEDIPHIMLHCPAHQMHRTRMMDTVSVAYKRGNEGAQFGALSGEQQIRVLLGAPAGCKLTEVGIDCAVKRFLRKAWKVRRPISLAINEEFDREDVVWTKREQGWRTRTVRSVQEEEEVGRDENNYKNKSVAGAPPHQEPVEGPLISGLGPRAGARRRLCY